MKLQCSTDQLLSATALAARFVQRQANLPVLSSILLAADSGSVVLRATNLECGVEISVGAKVLDGGSVAVPAHTLLGFLSNTRGKNISAHVEGGVLKLKTERASASIKAIPHDEFPVLPRVPAEHSFSLRSGDFSQALRAVLQCASTSTIKPELQSVFMFGEAGKLSCAATDSFRLAEKTITLKSRGSVPQMLIPARNAAELVRILDQASGEINFYYSENQISVQVDSVYYTSRLIDGAFPNYKQIIPKEFATEAVALREDLSQALKGLTVFSDKFLQVSLTVDAKEKTVMLSSRNADIGEEECVLKAATSGEGTSMNFNGRYFADGLSPISGESVRIQMNGPGKAMVMRDVSDNSYLYLAMPMNR